MRVPCSNTGIVGSKGSMAACSTHRDNNYSRLDNRRNSRQEIQNLLPELRSWSERQNAARERKPIQLQPIRLREAFSLVLPICWFFCEARRMHRALANWIGCGRSRGSQKAQKTGEVPALIVNRDDGSNADGRHRSSLSSLPAPETNDLFQWSVLPRIRLALQRGSANAFKVFDSSLNLLELRLYSFRLFTKRGQLNTKRPWQITATSRFI